MSDNALSTTALILSIVPFAVHGVEVMFPLLARWIVNGVLPFFGFALPSRATSLTANEQITMLDAAIEVAPHEKKTAAKDYIFLMLFEQRQGAICFTAVAAGAVYGITLLARGTGPTALRVRSDCSVDDARERKPRRDPVLGQPPQGVTTRKARGHCVRPILGSGGCAELVGIRKRLAVSAYSRWRLRRLDRPCSCGDAPSSSQLAEAHGLWSPDEARRRDTPDRHLDPMLRLSPSSLITPSRSAISISRPTTMYSAPIPPVDPIGPGRTPRPTSATTTESTAPRLTHHR